MSGKEPDYMIKTDRAKSKKSGMTKELNYKLMVSFRRQSNPNHDQSEFL